MQLQMYLFWITKVSNIFSPTVDDLEMQNCMNSQMKENIDIENRINVPTNLWISGTRAVTSPSWLNTSGCSWGGYCWRWTSDSRSSYKLIF